MGNLNPTSSEKKFLDDADNSCKLCKNFGTKSCPVFNKAVNDDGLDETVLQQEIDSLQDGQDLNECSNS